MASLQLAKRQEAVITEFPSESEMVSWKCCKARNLDNLGYGELSFSRRREVSKKYMVHKKLFPRTF